MKPVPPLLLNAIANSIPEPQVPKIWMEEKGREEENPDHPAYLKALSDRANEIGMRIIEATLLVGTELVSIPDGIAKPSDNSWIKRVELTGKILNQNDKDERYLTWLRFYAVETQEDLNKINSIPLQLAGIQEVEVETAIETFRSDEERGENNPIPNKNGHKNGHHVPANAARVSSRNRRT